MSKNQESKKSKTAALFISNVVPKPFSVILAVKNCHFSSVILAEKKFHFLFGFFKFVNIIGYVRKKIVFAIAYTYYSPPPKKSIQ